MGRIWRLCVKVYERRVRAGAGSKIPYPRRAQIRQRSPRRARDGIVDSLRDRYILDVMKNFLFASNSVNGAHYSTRFDGEIVSGRIGIGRSSVTHAALNIPQHIRTRTNSPRANRIAHNSRDLACRPKRGSARSIATYFIKASLLHSLDRG